MEQLQFPVQGNVGWRREAFLAEKQELPGDVCMVSSHQGGQQYL